MLDMKRDDFLKLLGRRIQATRKAKKISQVVLAEMSGIHFTHLSDIEGGKVNATICVYGAIANSLELPLTQLVDVSDRFKDDEKDLLTLIAQARVLDGRKKKFFLLGMQGILDGLRKL